MALSDAWSLQYRRYPMGVPESATWELLDRCYGVKLIGVST